MAEEVRAGKFCGGEKGVEAGTLQRILAEAGRCGCMHRHCCGTLFLLQRSYRSAEGAEAGGVSVFGAQNDRDASHRRSLCPLRSSTSRAGWCGGHGLQLSTSITLESRCGRRRQTEGWVPS